MSATYFLILIITLLAAFVRCFRLGKWSFWEDELFTIRHAMDISKDGLRAIDNCHPLYYLSIIPFLRRYGVNEWSARYVAALVGILSVPILTFALLPIIGTTQAMLFGLFLAISPWHVYWSQNARFYTMTFLLQFLGLLSLYCWVETNEWQQLALFFATYSLSVLAHETSALSLVVAFAYLLLISIFPSTAVESSTIMLAIGAILIAALYTVIVFLFVGGGYRKRKKTINDHWKIHYSHRRSGPLRVLGGALKFTGIATVAIGLVWIASRFLNLEANFERFDIFVFVLIFVPLGLVTVGSMVAYSTTRYSFLSLTGFLLAASNMTIELGAIHLWAGLAIAATLIITAVDDLALYYFAQNGNRERWREVLFEVKPRIQPRDRVLTTAPDLVVHYLERPVRWLTEFNCQMLDDLNGVNWFVLNEAVQSLPEQVRNWLDQNTTLIITDEVHYHLKRWHVSVRLYDANNKTARYANPSPVRERTDMNEK